MVDSGATTAVAIVVVAAEELSPEIAALVAGEAATDVQPRPANSNARSPKGTRDVPAESRPVIAVPPELTALATSIGQAWAQEYVRTLQEQERDIVGAWPGTIREARRQVLARVKSKLEPEQLDQLARMTNLAARRGWETVSEPDLEA